MLFSEKSRNGSQKCQVFGCLASLCGYFIVGHEKEMEGGEYSDSTHGNDEFYCESSAFANLFDRGEKSHVSRR